MASCGHARQLHATEKSPGPLFTGSSPLHQARSCCCLECRGSLRAQRLRRARTSTSEAEKRVAELWVGRRPYRIRLDSEDSSHPVMRWSPSPTTDDDKSCLTRPAPAPTNDPALVVSCDEPHFTVHWAGDLDSLTVASTCWSRSERIQLPAQAVVSFIGRAVRRARRGSGPIRPLRYVMVSV